MLGGFRLPQLEGQVLPFLHQDEGLEGCQARQQHLQLVVSVHAQHGLEHHHAVGDEEPEDCPLFGNGVP